MKISQLKVGAIVRCPSDMGSKGYTGKITSFSSVINENINGIEYVWVTVKNIDTNTHHVWPSNRLSSEE